ncbi:hypothetical protein niasHT_033463 [Heterodera trifolii]|uniref:Uncharacterized protein n=1 Tax=Heterodera trifolii TaxID=157864 RepID=A0ABD2IK75_9BILA
MIKIYSSEQLKLILIELVLRCSLLKSMNCVGLAEAIVRLLKQDYGCYAASSIIGTELKNKTTTNWPSMGTIWICIIKPIWSATLLPLSDIQRYRRGVVGLSPSLVFLLENLWPRLSSRQHNHQHGVKIMSDCIDHCARCNRLFPAELHPNNHRYNRPVVAVTQMNTCRFGLAQ